MLSSIHVVTPWGAGAVATEPHDVAIHQRGHGPGILPDSMRSRPNSGPSNSTLTLVQRKDEPPSPPGAQADATPASNRAWSGISPPWHLDLVTGTSQLHAVVVFAFTFILMIVFYAFFNLAFSTSVGMSAAQGERFLPP